MKEGKEELFHLSINIDKETAKAAKIQAINEGVSLRRWITTAIMQRLGTVKGAEEAGSGE
jgi:predicted HicB family RNase H-like nuclease